MNKKILFTVLVTIMFFSLLLSGCAKTPAEKFMEEIGDGVEQMTEDMQDLGESFDGDFIDDIDISNDMSSDSEQSMSGDKTPGDSYGRFLDAKGKGYDSLSEKMESDMELSMTAGMELLAMSMVDLEVVALTLVTDDIAASEAAGSMLGMNGLNITYSGEDFSLSYKGTQGETYVAKGKYDDKTDSLTCIWTKDGNETLMLEYVQYKDGYAGQYFITAEDGTTSVIKVLTDGEAIGVGMGDATSRPSSIYKSAPGDFSFVSGCSTMFVLQGGQGTSTMDGVETLF